MATAGMTGMVRGWTVLRDDSASDHRYVWFQIGEDGQAERTWRRNPRAADWKLYAERLAASVGNLPVLRCNGQQDLNEANTRLIDYMLKAWEEVSEEKEVTNRIFTPWWNEELSELKKRARKALDLARRARNQTRRKERLRILSNRASKVYRDAVMKAKRNIWRDYCANMRRIPEVARLTRILEKNPQEMLGALKKEDGNYTETDEEILGMLLEEHFPGIQRQVGEVRAEEERTVEEIIRATSYTETSVQVSSVIDTSEETRKIVNGERIKWAIGTFESYKAPGVDGIYPKMLKEAIPFIVEAGVVLMRASLEMGLIPEAWEVTKVVFLPKPGKKDYTTPKSFRPISLMSNVMKTMERMVDRYIKDEFLTRRPLHRFQHAFRAGHSVEVAVHHFVRKVEIAKKGKQVTLACFIDIEGAFNRTPTEVIIGALARFGVSELITKWIRRILTNRSVRTVRGEATAEGRANRGCPQGGILSPLLWSLAVDDLLYELEDSGVTVSAYADDVVFMVSNKDMGMAERIVQRALHTLENWCERTGLSVNPAKMEVIRIANKNRRPTYNGLRYMGQTLELSRKVRYLGVMVNDTLTWREHVFQQVRKAKSNMNMVCRMVGPTWGLTPVVVKWIYEAIVIPRITFGAAIWWRTANMITVRTKLDSVQGIALRRIYGAMRTAPIRALEIIVNIPPLHIRIKELAMRTMLRLQSWEHWRESHESQLDTRGGRRGGIEWYKRATEGLNCQKIYV